MNIKNWGTLAGDSTVVQNIWDIVEKEKLLPLLGIELQFLGHPACSLLIILTDLHQLSALVSSITVAMITEETKFNLHKCATSVSDNGLGS
jgi:hypothetical protein